MHPAGSPFIRAWVRRRKTRLPWPGAAATASSPSSSHPHSRLSLCPTAHEPERANHQRRQRSKAGALTATAPTQAADAGLQRHVHAEPAFPSSECWEDARVGCSYCCVRFAKWRGARTPVSPVRSIPLPLARAPGDACVYSTLCSFRAAAVWCDFLKVYERWVNESHRSQPRRRSMNSVKVHLYFRPRVIITDAICRDLRVICCSRSLRRATSS